MAAISVSSSLGIAERVSGYFGKIQIIYVPSLRPEFQKNDAHTLNIILPFTVSL